VRLIKQAQSVRLGPPQAVMFRLPCGEGDKAQNRSNGVVGETYTHHQAVLKSVIHQKQVIADSSGQAATVWDLGGQPASYSGKEYSRLFKEIMGALT
jgi:chromosome partitioning protein